MSRILAALLVLGGAAFVAAYAGIALQRVGYPFELEWMEGGLVDNVRRVLAGEALYVAPSVDFLPFGYPPLYYWASAAVASVTGIGYLPLRLVSFAASIGSFVVIYALVRRETGARLPSVLAACLFAATFPVSAGWFDVARIDTLGVFLLLVAIYAARFARSPKGAVVAGIALFAAFLAKQIALTAAFPIALCYVLFRRRLFLPFTGSFAVLVVGSTWLLDALSGGWFYYYIFEFHAGRGSDPHLWPVFLRVDVLVLFAAVLLGAVYVIAKLRQRATRAEGAYYLLLAGALTCACAFARSLALGAGPNVSMPIHALLAVLFGLGAHEIDVRLRRCDELPRARWLRPAFLLLCALQLVWLVYDPRQHVPRPADRAAGEALVARLRGIEGDVFVPCHPWLAAQAGKRTWVHAVNVYDELYQERKSQSHASPSPEVVPFQRALQTAIEERRFAAIVLDYDWTSETWFQSAIEANYDLAERLFEPDDPAFRPVTGVPARPDKLYLRKS